MVEIIFEGFSKKTEEALKMAVKKAVLSGQNLTREQAIEIVGVDVVEKLETENCEYSRNRNNSSIQEWTSHLKIDNECEFSRITAHYFVTDEEIKEAKDDLSNIDWKINHYSVYE